MGGLPALNAVHRSRPAERSIASGASRQTRTEPNKTGKAQGSFNEWLQGTRFLRPAESGAAGEERSPEQIPLPARARRSCRGGAARRTRGDRSQARGSAARPRGRKGRAEADRGRSRGRRGRAPRTRKGRGRGAPGRGRDRPEGQARRALRRPQGTRPGEEKEVAPSFRVESLTMEKSE